VRLIEVGRPDYSRSFLIGAVLTGAAFAVMPPKANENGVRPVSSGAWIGGGAIAGGLLAMLNPHQRWIKVDP
jgi:hypothetical protein